MLGFIFFHLIFIWKYSFLEEETRRALRFVGNKNRYFMFFRFINLGIVEYTFGDCVWFSIYKGFRSFFGKDKRF